MHDGRDRDLDVQHLRSQIERLQENIAGLRASRRVLLDLLAFRDRDRLERIRLLEEENRRLRNRFRRLRPASKRRLS